MKILKSERGFTLIELAVISAIVIFLFGFISLNLANVQKITSVNSAVDVMVSDLKSQQTKAMAGQSIDGTGESFGVYFQSDRYILFSGAAYLSTNPSNFTVNLGSGIEFANSTFPNNTIVFSRQSGELNGFVDGANTIDIQNTQGSSKKTITVNRYGVVTKIE